MPAFLLEAMVTGDLTKDVSNIQNLLHEGSKESLLPYQRQLYNSQLPDEEEGADP